LDDLAWNCPRYSVHCIHSTNGS